nr:hypothetical protein SFHH103_04612 [Sinorhizobium fredii HH103]
MTRQVQISERARRGTTTCVFCHGGAPCHLVDTDTVEEMGGSPDDRLGRRFQAPRLPPVNVLLEKGPCMKAFTMPSCRIRKFLITPIRHHAPPLLSGDKPVDLHTNVRIGAHPFDLLPGHGKSVEAFAGICVVDWDDIGLVVFRTREPRQPLCRKKRDALLFGHFPDEHGSIPSSKKSLSLMLDRRARLDATQMGRQHERPKAVQESF